MAKTEKGSKAQPKKRDGKGAVQEVDKAAAAKLLEVDLYANVVKSEEELARVRDADEDTQVYLSTCKEISNILLEIAALKVQDDENSLSKIKEKQIQITLKIMLLKKLNRLEKMRTKDCRQSLQTYLEQVDSDNLHLQNLVYEQLHLSKEVTKCYDFKSVDEDMDLISVEEFYATAPPTISKPNETKDNPHNLKLARLAWELMQRKDLSKKLKKMEADKEVVARDIEAKKDQLSNLEPHLKAILDATKPLQDTLGVQVDKTKKLYELALLLPKALYVLFVQAEAYSHIAKWVSVSIRGKADDIVAADNHFDYVSSAGSDSDDGEPTRRRKLINQDRRKSGGSGITENAERQLSCLKRHPLSVDLKVSLRNGNTVALQFQWLTVLEVVCVLPSVSMNGSAGLAAADLLSSTAIFSSLFRGDVGDKSPNPSTYYHLQRAGLESFPINIPDLGIPYIWAQTLCGINFVADTASVSVDICRRSLESTLLAIRTRLKSRLALASEVKRLESGECFRDKKLQARLLSFSAVPITDLQKVPTAAQMLEKAVIDGTHLAYRASVDVHDVRLTAYFILAPSYPSTLPIVCLEVNRKKMLTAATCDHIRDFEREMNSINEEYVGEDILLHQIQKLLLCCEILVATELFPERPVKATFFRGISGRARSHPFRHSKAAGGIFTHRT